MFPFLTDTTVTLTTRATTTTTTALGSSSNCLNGGVYVDGICNCPNGYSGVLCADKTGKEFYSNDDINNKFILRYEFM